MEYILTFKAKFNCTMQIDNLNKVLKLDDEIKFKVFLNNGENFKVIITPNFEKENQTSLVYEIQILNNNNNLEITSNNVKVYEIENEFLIELYNEIILKDINILHSSNQVLVYNTIKTHILSKNLSVELPALFTNFNNKKIGSINCFEFSNNTSNYLVLLNNNTVIFSDYYLEFKTEKNSLKILSTIPDIAKHGKLTTIDTINFSKTEEIVYTQNEPKLVKNKKLIPLAFLQALKVNNIKLMKYYLSENLKNVGNLENFKDYFGNFKKCTFKFNENIITANLFYPNKTPKHFLGKSFVFELKEDKIDKIN